MGECMSDQNQIVGTCPTCGAPLYSQGEVKNGQAPRIIYSCDCRLKKDNQKTSSSGKMTKYGAATAY